MNLAQIGVVLMATVVSGQSQTTTVPKPKFEVASIKPLAPPYPSGGGAWINDHGRFSAPITAVRAVVGAAYGLIPAQVVGGPA